MREEEQVIFEKSLLNPEIGWEKLEDLSVIGGARPFMTGSENRHILRLTYFRREKDGALVGRIWFGPGAEGPPNHAHGGIIAGLFDEVMGAATWLAGYPILAARVNVTFLKPVPLGIINVYEAWVERIDGKRIHARARILSPQDDEYAVADGTFILIDRQRLADMRGDTP